MFLVVHQLQKHQCTEFYNYRRRLEEPELLKDKSKINNEKNEVTPRTVKGNPEL
jgi:hypothetical protein